MLNNKTLYEGDTFDFLILGHQQFKPEFVFIRSSFASSSDDKYHYENGDEAAGQLVLSGIALSNPHFGLCFFLSSMQRAWFLVNLPFCYHVRYIICIYNKERKSFKYSSPQVETTSGDSFTDCSKGSMLSTSKLEQRELHEV